MTDRSDTPDIGAKIEAQATTLRDLLAGKSTESVVGWCAVHTQRRAADIEDRDGLHSPYRQIAFLIGLLLSTPEPTVGAQIEEDEWLHVMTALNDVYYTYNDLFLPTTVAELRAISPASVRARDVAMPAFQHYFFSGLLASAEQIRARIQRNVVPFDSDLRSIWGFTATEALEVADWIAEHLQRALDTASELAIHEKKNRLATLDLPAKSVEEIRENAAASGYLTVLDDYLAAVRRLNKLQRADLIARFGKFGNLYWNQFSIGRGDGGALTYPTERSDVELRPLVRVSDAEAMCLSGNALYNALLRAAEDALLATTVRERFLAARDSLLEREVARLMRRFVGVDAVIHSSVAEQPDGQFEHDVIVVAGDTVFVLEAKASPPTQPFRNPNKALVRLERAFRSDKGIQKGFDQSMRIWRRLTAGQKVTLYDAHGTLAFELIPERVSQCFCVCVTRDDFGSLATDLSLLLEKNAKEPFPWVPNILDLEALADAWEFLGWGAAELVRYLLQRTPLHGRTFSNDELDFAGAFVRHGSLQAFDGGENTRMVLDPHYSKFFDELYMYTHQAGPAPRTDIGQPFVSDLRASLAAGVPVAFDQTRVGDSRYAVPRPHNDTWCECGSGFKRSVCCDRSTE